MKIKILHFSLLIFITSQLFSQWTWIDPLPSGYVIQCIDFKDKDHGIFGSRGGSITMYNDGVWSNYQLPTIDNIADIKIIDENHAWALTDSGKVWHFVSGSWNLNYETFENSLFNFAFIDDNYGMVMGNTLDHCFIYQDGVWSFQLTGLAESFTSVSSKLKLFDENNGFYGDSNSQYLLKDGVWSYFNDSTGIDIDTIYSGYFYIDFKAVDDAYIVYGNGVFDKKIYHYNGISTLQVYSFPATLGIIDFHYDKSGVFYVLASSPASEYYLVIFNGSEWDQIPLQYDGENLTYYTEIPDAYWSLGSAKTCFDGDTTIYFNGYTGKINFTNGNSYFRHIELKDFFNSRKSFKVFDNENAYFFGVNFIKKWNYGDWINFALPFGDTTQIIDFGFIDTSKFIITCADVLTNQKIYSYLFNGTTFSEIPVDDDGDLQNNTPTDLRIVDPNHIYAVGAKASGYWFYNGTYWNVLNAAGLTSRLTSFIPFSSSFGYATGDDFKFYKFDGYEFTNISTDIGYFNDHTYFLNPYFGYSFNEELHKWNGEKFVTVDLPFDISGITITGADFIDTTLGFFTTNKNFLIEYNNGVYSVFTPIIPLTSKSDPMLWSSHISISNDNKIWIRGSGSNGSGTLSINLDGTSTPVINPIVSYNSLQLFPNPADNILNIRNSNSDYSNLKIQILNLSGQVVKQINCEYCSDIISLRIGDLQSGIYLLEFLSNYKSPKLALFVKK